MTNKLIPMPDKGWAMPLFGGRSGLLRTQPASRSFALREPAAIAWLALSPFALWAIYLWVSLPAVGAGQ